MTWRLCRIFSFIDAIELLSKHEAYSQSARKEAGMIMKIESYPELADPQLRPRYTGIPTFFRLPHTMRLDDDIGLVGCHSTVVSPIAQARATARATSATSRRSSARSTRRPAWRPST